MTAPDLGFEHVFTAPAAPDAPTLLLLHGTGGTEHDLVPLGGIARAWRGGAQPARQSARSAACRASSAAWPKACSTSTISRFRTHELAEFVGAASRHYGFDRARVVAVGFSNGANIAASTLLLEPGVLAGAILFRAMVPIVPDPLPSLQGTPVFMSNGRTDSLIPAADAERLAELLRQAGADVTLEWQPGGHQLTRQDVAQAQEWLRTR